ncbi:MAG: DCC1-like thiol-disulfide oxidoreductase family protein [Bacteroidota bacterium]
MKFYSPYQFSLFRIIFGIYLIIHFSFLFPYASELWSNKGVLPDNSLNFTYGVFPSVLDVVDSPVFTSVFISIMLLLSVMFTFGIQRRLISILIWYGWVCLFDRNNLISNPGIPFVGWILLCCAIVPKGEPFALFTAKNENWEFPKIIFYGAWVIMALSYSISGIDKLCSPSWTDGSVIIHLLNNPLARALPTREYLLLLPESILNFMTWLILFLEIAFAPLVIWNRTRVWAWLSMIIMHLGILVMVDFADLTFGMLMIHFFTFDARWIKPKVSKAEKPIVFFDGVCGLCNSSVDLLMKEDRINVLLFAPLQGETAKNSLPPEIIKNLKSLVFYKNNCVYTQSDAVIEIGKAIGGFWGLSFLLKVIPKFARNLFYNLIAKNRYKWFGMKETCRMPTKDERERLLF